MTKQEERKQTKNTSNESWDNSTGIIAIKWIRGKHNEYYATEFENLQNLQKFTKFL